MDPIQVKHDIDWLIAKVEDLAATAKNLADVVTLMEDHPPTCE